MDQKVNSTTRLGAKGKL